MKSVDIDQIGQLPGRRIEENDTFLFRCHPGVACFNRCCRNLNLFLYPYDVIRLKNSLGISSDEFLDQYVDFVLRPSNFFPDVLLRMSENHEHTCPFLQVSGCSVYPDRPDTCRTFPLEQGLLYDAALRKNRPIYFFRPPDFCLGRHEDQVWTIPSWSKDQEADTYHEMTIRWAELKQLFQTDPWGREGPEGPRAKMAFMATYNMDQFRDFVFHSSFLKRYRVKSALLRKTASDDAELLKLGLAWVKLFLWGMPSKSIRPR
ncbi:MAG: YkgJ family cysteine cluster protein [Desulfobacterales bacterium]|nr:MAG: YkgJ family cysteine cluster protein [Desulfobacterales bacterium]